MLCQEATCYVYMLRLWSALLKLPTVPPWLARTTCVQGCADADEAGARVLALPAVDARLLRTRRHRELALRSWNMGGACSIYATRGAVNRTRRFASS